MWVEDEQQKQALTSGTPSVGAGGGVAGAPTGTTSNPSTQTPVQANQPTQTFGTVQDYLKGNQQQGEALGQQFTGNLSATQAKDKSAIDTAANQAKGAVTAGTTNYDAGLVNQAVADPTKITGNPDQLGAFLKQWNAAYTGPTSFENSAAYNPALTATSEATQKGTEAGTAGGQQQILQDEFGVRGQGNAQLDQAILQNSSYNPQVQKQAKDLTSVQDYLQQQASGVNAAATKAAADTAATQTQAKGAFANNLSNFQTDLNKRVTEAQGPAAEQAKKLQADFASGDADKIAADLKAANPNMDTKSIQQYLAANQQDFGKPVDLSKFYNYNPTTAITAANVATPEDYAKAEAYGKLTGQDYSGVLNPADAAKAGNAPTAISGINGTNLADYLKNQYIGSELSRLGVAPAANGNASNTPDIVGATPTSGSGAKGPQFGTPGDALLTGGLSMAPGVISGLSDSINKSLGIGGGKKDAVVYLPPMNLPPVKAPSAADPATTKMVVDIFNTPLSTTGSYHEGAVSDIVGRLDKLKAARDSGQLTPQEFTSYAQPLEEWAQQASQKIMSASSQAANANKPAFNRLQQYLKPAAPVKAQ